MAESIKDKVAIIGMGCTRFGELWDTGVNDLVYEAASEAIGDAGIELKDIQAAWAGFSKQETAKSGLALSRVLQLQSKPVSHVENLCATGAEAVRGAAYGVASRQYDIALVVCFEKLKDTGFRGLAGAPAGAWHPLYGGGGADVGEAAGRYAQAATAYFSKYGLSPEEGKRILAKISVKSHHNGARNPKAHLRREVTLEEVMNAPMVAWPLGLYDCCGVTDGASAAVLVRSEDARSFRDDYVTIKGFGIAASAGWGAERPDYDFTYWDATEAAAKEAYKQAGIKNPRKELDMAEVHDCFSIAELIGVESLGICEYGHGREDVESGAWEQDGEIPINISGGLKSFGHPVGASGGREIYEIYKQIQGKAQEPSRQLKDVKLGLAHNQGGLPGSFICGVTIVGLP